MSYRLRAQGVPAGRKNAVRKVTRGRNDRAWDFWLCSREVEVELRILGTSLP